MRVRLSPVLPVRLLSAALILAGLLPVAAGATEYWQPVQQLTSAPDNCNLPAFGRGLAVRENFIHIAYTTRTQDRWRVFYLRSTDRGETWADPVMLEDALEGFAFSIAADGEDNVHLVTRRPGGRLSYRRSTDNGANWAPARELGGADNPQLLTDGGSYVYIIDPGGGGLDAALYIRRSTDGGANWLAPAFVASSGGFGGLCAAAAPDGRVHVAWGEGPSGESHIFHVRSTNRGASWSQVQRVTSSPRAMPKGIWAGAGGDLLLAFTRYQGPQNYRYSNNAGVSWSEELTLPVLLEACATDTLDGIHALGVVDTDRVAYLRSASRGARWTGLLNISGLEPGTRSRVQLETDEGTNLFAVWNSRQTGRVQVYLRRGAGLAGVSGPGPDQPVRAGRLFPNPAAGIVHLSGAEQARLYNRAGREVGQLRGGANDIGELSPGVYFVRFGPEPGRMLKLIKTGRQFSGD